MLPCYQTNSRDFVSCSLQALESASSSSHLHMWLWTPTSIYVSAKHHRKTMLSLLTWLRLCSPYAGLSRLILLLWIHRVECSPSKVIPIHRMEQHRFITLLLLVMLCSWSIIENNSSSWECNAFRIWEGVIKYLLINVVILQYHPMGSRLIEFQQS